MSLPGDIDELRDIVLACKARWVVIDPLPAQLSHEYDAHKDQGVRGALAPLVQMAEDTHSAIAGIVHFNKNEGATVLARIGGSVAWAAAPRSVLAFVEDPDDETQRIVVHAKSSMGPVQPPLRYTVEQTSIVEGGEQVATSRIVEGDEDPDLDTSMILQRRDRTSPQREKAAGLITAYLASGPQQWDAVVAVLKAADISEHTGRRARDELQADGVIGHSRDGTIGPHFWHLPAHDDRLRGQMGKNESYKEFDGQVDPLAQLPTDGQSMGKSDPLTEATDNVQADFPTAAEVQGST